MCAAHVEFEWSQFFDLRLFEDGKFKRVDNVSSCIADDRSAALYACKTWARQLSSELRTTHARKYNISSESLPLDVVESDEPEPRTCVLKMYAPSQSAVFETEKFVLDELAGHRHVVECHGVVADDTSGCKGLVLDYAEGGDLLSYLRSHGALPEARAAALFAQIVSALLGAHERDICHRDAKPDNVLFVDAERTRVVLSDWGLATRFVAGKRVLRRACGSLLFCAPEILRQECYEGPEVDAYSVGQLLYSMVTGEIMFIGDEPADVLHDMRSHMPRYPSGTSTELRSLVAGLVAERANRRLSLEDVVFHPWLKKFDIDLRPHVTDQGVESSLSMPAIGVVSHQISSSCASTSLSAVLAGFVPPDHLRHGGRRSANAADLIERGGGVIGNIDNSDDDIYGDNERHVAAAPSASSSRPSQLSLSIRQAQQYGRIGVAASLDSVAVSSLRTGGPRLPSSRDVQRSLESSTRVTFNSF
jgi:serine/threonine protein kinase